MVSALLVILSFFSNALANSALLDKAEEIAASDDIVGLAVAVVRDGEIETIQTFGLRNVETGAAVQPSTVFRIASLSKGFTATLAAQLVAEEALSFDDLITTYISDFRLKGGGEARATLGHVLSHRVGLPPYAYDNLLEAGTPPAAIRTRFGRVDPICSVGNCYAYQNTAFDTARFAIESKLEASFSDALQERLFTPLGMTTASASMASFLMTPDRATSYSRRGAGPWYERPVRSAYYDVRRRWRQRFHFRHGGLALCANGWQSRSIGS